MLNDCATDSKDLVAKRAGYQGQVLPTTETTMVQPDVAQFDNLLGFRRASGAERDFYTANRVVGTLRTLEFIAAHLFR